MTVADSSQSRIWIIEGGAGPDKTPRYFPGMKAGKSAWAFGDVTNVYDPDPSTYGLFEVTGETQSGRSRATIPLMGRYSVKDLSDLLRWGDSGCLLDVLVFQGECGQDPADFNAGWDKITVFPGSKVTNYAPDRDFGAWQPDDVKEINETSDLSARLQAEIVRLKFAEVAKAQVTGLITGIATCHGTACSDCGNGAQHVFAVSASSVASPTSGNDIVVSQDGGLTWAAYTIPLWNNQAEPSGVACVGDYVVVVNFGATQFGYTRKADLLAGTPAWTAVNTIPYGPLAIYSYRSDLTWIAHDTGRVSLLRNPTQAQIYMHSGTETTENLNAIHAFDSQHVLAVGNANAVIYTTDQGDTWQSVTGPAAGVNLRCCWMRAPGVWMVGTATGGLYYTTDYGVTWTGQGFPNSPAGGVVRAIAFDRKLPNVGYMAYNDNTPNGYLLRTVNGGKSWYAMPESGVAGRLPTLDYLAGIAIGDANRVFAGGLNANGSDGIIVRAYPV